MRKQKEKIQEILNIFPDNTTIGELSDQIIISAKIEKALYQLSNGYYLTSKQLDRKING